MKSKILAFLASAALAVTQFDSAALSPLVDTNNVWTLTDHTGTNSLLDVSRAGDLRSQGSVTASSASLPSITAGKLTIQTNLIVGTTANIAGAATFSNTVSIAGIPTFAATQLVFSAAAVANTNATLPLQGIAVRVNGTNYVLKLYPITGP